MDLGPDRAELRKGEIAPTAGPEAEQTHSPSAPDVLFQFQTTDLSVDPQAILRFWAVQISAAISAARSEAQQAEIPQVQRALRALITNLFPADSGIQFESAATTLNLKLGATSAETGAGMSNAREIALQTLKLFQTFDNILADDKQERRDLRLLQFVYYLDTGSTIEGKPDSPSLARRSFPSLVEEAALRVGGFIAPSALDGSIFTLALETNSDRMLFWAGLDVTMRFARATDGMRSDADVQSVRSSVIKSLAQQASQRIPQLHNAEISHEVGGIYRVLASFGADAIPAFVNTIQNFRKELNPSSPRGKEVAWALSALEYMPSAVFAPFVTHIQPTRRNGSTDIIDSLVELSRHPFEGIQACAVGALLSIAPQDWRTAQKMALLRDNYTEMPRPLQLLTDVFAVLTELHTSGVSATSNPRHFAALANQRILNLSAELAIFSKTVRPCPRILEPLLQSIRPGGALT